MKVLVYFQPDPKYDIFEGARLRKTIKGALELSEVPYTDMVLDNYDVAHFIYVEDENIIDELKERHIPIVVSALYCEDDPAASYIEYKNKDGERTYAIKAKALKFLERADLVLVPNKAAKEMLVNEGLKTNIEICPPGVNFSRFDFSRDDEKELFYRYFSCESGKKIVLAVGDCSTELDGLSVILNAAKVCEDTNFYYLARNEHGYRMNRKLKKEIKKLPRNVFFANMVPDDIYRSALLNADVYLHPGYKPAGIISVYEGVAAKCQLIVRKQDLLDEIAIAQETAYVASYSETLSGLIKDYVDGKLKPTIDKAYKMVSKYDIKVFGNNIIKHYQKLIDEFRR